VNDKAIALATEFLVDGPLTRPLTFGDAEQIAALRKWTGQLLEAEEAAEQKATEQEWKVTYTVERTVTVIADSAEEAEEIAEDEECDGDVVYVSNTRRLGRFEGSA
jgi:hypothetical protein